MDFGARVAGGATLLGLSCMLMAVAQLDRGCIRKSLQCTIILSLVNLDVTCNCASVSGFYFAIGLQLLSIAAALHACYGMTPGPWEQTRAVSRTPLRMYVRYRGAACAVTGLAMLYSFAKEIDHANSLSPVDTHILIWSSSALLSAACFLLAVAQSDDVACRKAALYGLVEPIASILFVHAAELSRDDALQILLPNWTHLLLAVWITSGQ